MKLTHSISDKIIKSLTIRNESSKHFSCSDMLTGRCHWGIAFTTDTLLGRFPNELSLNHPQDRDTNNLAVGLQQFQMART
jgi:hypothetical protein